MSGCCSSTSPSGSSPAAGSPSLDAKLAIFDEHADAAVVYLIDWLGDHATDLIAVARGRHVTGHLLYANTNFLEYDNGRLLAETAEELADAIVYISRLLHRTA